VGLTSVVAPVCVDCKHFRPSDRGLNCRAFPDGIPDVVILGGKPHTEPISGDHGIRFEPGRQRPVGWRTATRPTRTDR
jgi:hypothetical protein